MMKVVKITLVALILVGLAVSQFGCKSADDEAVAENQSVTVQRGDLTVDVTAVGNLALSNTVDLAFEMDGTVEEVLVEEGDSVEEGQVLAKLDTSAWEDELITLERQVVLAERELTTKESQVVARELALREAEIDVRVAECGLSTIEEVKEVQDSIDDAEYDLKIAQAMWEKAINLGMSSLA